MRACVIWLFAFLVIATGFALLGVVLSASVGPVEVATIFILAVLVAVGDARHRKSTTKEQHANQNS